MFAEDFARRYANQVLRRFGLSGDVVAGADPPELAWRRAGLCDITGVKTGLICPAALASAADGALLALKALAPDAHALPATGAELLGERARLLGLRRGGRISANGACRLLDAADGRIALNLPRADDWRLMPILLDCESAETWDAVAARVAGLRADDLVAFGVELGLAIAHDRPARAASEIDWPICKRAHAPRRAPRVVDLSALWAGPLASSLLGMLGAHVTKVETTTRPDGARFGDARFFELLNGAKAHAVIDLQAQSGRSALHDLLSSSDIVIESARPRALQRLGFDREAYVAQGAIWVSIVAHPCQPDRAGFGDDAAVEAGLCSLMERGFGAAMFVGDAIADPLTALHVALGAWAVWRADKRCLWEVALSEIVQAAMGAGVALDADLWAAQARANADTQPLYPLRAAPAHARQYEQQAIQGKRWRTNMPQRKDDDFFWEGVDAGKLLAQVCTDCNTVRHPPAPMCAACQSLNWSARELSGRGAIYSWIISKHPNRPGDERTVVLVDLEEGTRLIANMASDEAVAIGDKVQATFAERDGVRLPCFRKVA